MDASLIKDNPRHPSIVAVGGIIIVKGVITVMDY